MFNWLSATPGKHHPIVEYTIEKFLSKLSGKKYIVDLGCGYGNEVLFLLRKGFYVYAIDSDLKALCITYNKIKELCKELNSLEFLEKVCLIYGEVPYVLAQEPLRREWDCIICINLLQHLPPKDAKLTLEWMLKNTKHKGINVVSAFVEGSGQHFKTLFKPGELSEIYKRAGWKVLVENSGVIPKHTDNIHPNDELEHYYDLVVARK